ncbi:hypothetical protein RRG08_049500 [Elysia crispata]|uniref:Uncharacterized protein n=1 Tax=Elysia crispata TaxID=231223 RepID=A0AAE1DEW5_9GAST|nr:hypothetical protein RRG08_049500 [Elysia crispata]
MRIFALVTLMIFGVSAKTEEISRLEDKLPKLENKFETLIKQLERKLKDKINTVLQRGIEDMTAIREQMNALQSDVQPVVCQRDMAFSKLPRYVITTVKTIHREVLGETQTDHGGWIVI